MSTKETTAGWQQSGHMVFDADGGYIAKCGNSTDAGRIVRAVNAHDDLVNALRVALGQLEGVRLQGGVHDSSLRADVEIIRTAIDKADGAL